MPDGVKVSVWYSEEGISFRRGNGARRNPEKILSWDEAAERIEPLYKKGKFTTNTLAFFTVKCCNIPGGVCCTVKLSSRLPES